MKHFVYPFQRLLEYRSARRSLCRQLLVQVQIEQQTLHHQRASLQARRLEHLAELRRLGEKGPVDIHRSKFLRNHVAGLAEELRLIQRNQRVLARQWALCRETLIKADQDVKVLEKLQETRKAEHQYRQNRETARHREEDWLGRHAQEYAR